MLTLSNYSHFENIYDKFYLNSNKDMNMNMNIQKQEEEDIYEQYRNQSLQFLKNIQLTTNTEIKDTTKFVCLYPSLLQYKSAIKIQKWWERMRAKLLSLNHIKYQQCEDCGKWRKLYNKNNKSDNEIMIDNACADYLDYGHLGWCCIKYVCKDNKCSYLLQCCNNITLRNEESCLDDSNKYITIQCNHCNSENEVKLTWYGMSVQEYINKYD